MVSPGEFETCPDWVPTLDRRPRCARISPKTIDVCGFDQRGQLAAKVRNVSQTGEPKSNHLKTLACREVIRVKSFVLRFES
jgi:hypothetical protein